MAAATHAGKEAEKAAAAARSDLAVALRVQTMAQADLRDLQTRFGQSEQARQEQAALLQKLTPRLQQAAAQLQALSHAEEPSREAYFEDMDRGASQIDQDGSEMQAPARNVSEKKAKKVSSSKGGSKSRKAKSKAPKEHTLKESRPRQGKKASGKAR